MLQKQLVVILVTLAEKLTMPLFQEVLYLL